jgi:hypothetical protein
VYIQPVDGDPVNFTADMDTEDVRCITWQCAAGLLPTEFFEQREVGIRRVHDL